MLSRSMSAAAGCEPAPRPAVSTQRGRAGDHVLYTLGYSSAMRACSLATAAASPHSVSKARYRSQMLRARSRDSAGRARSATARTSAARERERRRGVKGDRRTVVVAKGGQEVDVRQHKVRLGRVRLHAHLKHPPRCLGVAVQLVLQLRCARTRQPTAHEGAAGGVPVAV
jgi:hypothetical protein